MTWRAAVVARGASPGYVPRQAPWHRYDWGRCAALWPKGKHDVTQVPNVEYGAYTLDGFVIESVVGHTSWGFSDGYAITDILNAAEEDLKNNAGESTPSTVGALPNATTTDPVVASETPGMSSGSGWHLPNLPSLPGFGWLEKLAGLLHMSWPVALALVALVLLFVLMQLGVFSRRKGA